MTNTVTIPKIILLFLLCPNFTRSKIYKLKISLMYVYVVLPRRKNFKREKKSIPIDIELKLRNIKFTLQYTILLNFEITYEFDIMKMCVKN